MAALPKALIAWSSGKDSAWALHEARRAGEFDIVGALTTVTDTFARVSMHGVREELLMRAARRRRIAGRGCAHSHIHARTRSMSSGMAAAIADAKARGVTHMIFGDLYLEDVRAYREKNLAGTGITPVFPLWLKPTGSLARDMIDAGVEAHLAVVDLKKLPAAFAGRRFDAGLIGACPPAAILAARTANSTPSYRPGRCSARKIVVRSGKRSSATASRSRIYCRPRA